MPHDEQNPGDPEVQTQPTAVVPEADAPRQRAGRLSRRGLLTGGGVIGAGALVGSFFAGRAVAGDPAGSTAAGPTPTATPTKGAHDEKHASKEPPWRSFISTPVKAAPVTSWRRGGTAPGYLFVEPHREGFRGMIVDDGGEPVWLEPTGANLTDLRVQSFEGRPVLTYWSGTSDAGHGAGSCTILDTGYRPVATVSAGNGLKADLHEFNLTDRGTALITAYKTQKHDLRPLGGPRHGYIFDCHVQEIDVRTGAVLLDWDAIQHVDITETYLGLKQDKGHDGTSPERAFDFFHLNAVEDDGDALLVSSRHTHTVYRVGRSDGAVRWRLGGKKSDFAVASDAVFAWQHDVRRQPDGTVSLFDNHRYSGPEGASRGMFFRLDEAAMTATLVRSFAYGHRLGTAMGSTQLLDNGNVLVGWGTEPSLTEFTADGTPVYGARLGGISYRVNRSVWQAQPSWLPDVGTKKGPGDRMTVAASWNGATGVAEWRVLTGATDAGLSAVTTVVREGFETTVPVPPARKVAVQALDASGAVLATSKTVTAHG